VSNSGVAICAEKVVLHERLFRLQSPGIVSAQCRFRRIALDLLQKVCVRCKHELAGKHFGLELAYSAEDGAAWNHRRSIDKDQGNWQTSRQG